MEIDVLVDSEFTACPGENWLKSVTGQVLLSQNVGSDVELGLVITTQERVRELNRSYRGEDKPTDVLAFYMTPDAKGTELSAFVIPPDGVCHLGEVIISCPQAVIQAEARRHSLKKEMAVLIIHGVLHLLGYDHGDSEHEREMKAREMKILSDLEGEPGNEL